MNVFTAIILGIVQGLTEFLPVSSSGHLVLFQKILGVSGDMLFFDTLLHLGTLVAVVAVLWNEIVAIFKNIFGKTTWLLVIATIPAGIASLLLEDLIEEAFGGSYLGVGFLLTSLFLILAEQLFMRRKRKKTEIGYVDALGMGLMQAVAIFPGISRSGATLSAGLALGVERETATHFSFLMTIPVILGSTLLQGYKVIKEGAEQIAIFPTIIGVLFAAAAGFFAVKWMLKLIATKKLYGFAIYTAVLGIIILADQLFLHLIF
ncbi:MAG: undecaprenyl-diphosphate phosphatase [Christensenellaceae bacterium]|jgi:undecaprenyl-diphosphatase